MKIIIFISISVAFFATLQAQQKVGIGITTPVAKLDIRGTGSNPTIPGFVSTGVLRIGISNDEAIDIGKMVAAPYSGWIQSGFNGSVADPLALQPMGGSVGIGTSSPSTVAALDINSTTKGFLPPRMTMANRNAISSPPEGLVIWCTNCGVYGQLQIFNGWIWTDINGSLAKNDPIAGDQDGGGVVAYILQSWDPGYVPGEVHGLISAPTDEPEYFTWGCYGSELAGADGIIIGTGNQNTIDIVNGCSSSTIAAKLCYDLILGGYSDWYLPSLNELNKIYNSQVLIGGFVSEFYHSSSEINSLNAWGQNFITGEQLSVPKNTPQKARAIRKF